MEYAIKQLFHIDASREKVFNAIATIEGLSNWWTVQTKGMEGLGAEIEFDFGSFLGPTMKVIEHVPNETLVWECVARSEGWHGHTFVFALDENDGKTRIRFSHNGWKEQDDFYSHCSFSWGRYLESLRQYCQTGRGEAFGSEGYRK
ncbi:SRPBCC domain-containing protein [Aureisphaera galaxeae]|uniref:SRPBCC family protein n=1 Tax=Aureisphaera galaxeae TaxID=1538023 RepID=UPI002350851E|nr:SRPBCC domain-containing protein [Aureisphaera galaxeae]MDC8004889.1 SRPBCC domain-containing protein [Aureisphaera galaxeae]